MQLQRKKAEELVVDSWSKVRSIPNYEKVAGELLFRRYVFFRDSLMIAKPQLRLNVYTDVDFLTFHVLQTDSSN